MRGVNAKVSVPVDLSEPALLPTSLVEWQITEFRSIQLELKFPFPSYKQACRFVILWGPLPLFFIFFFFVKLLHNISRINDRTFLNEPETLYGNKQNENENVLFIDFKSKYSLANTNVSTITLPLLFPQHRLRRGN